MLKYIAVIMILVGGMLMLFSGDMDIQSEQVGTAGKTVSIITEEDIAWEPYAGGGLLLGGFVILLLRKSKPEPKDS